MFDSNFGALESLMGLKNELVGHISCSCVRLASYMVPGTIVMQLRSIAKAELHFPKLLVV